MRAACVLIMYFTCQNVADREVVQNPEDAQEDANEAAIQKLAIFVGDEDSVCGNDEIKKLLRGTPTGESDAQIFEAIDAIPWKDIEDLSYKFTNDTENEMKRLLLESDRLRKSKEEREAFEEWKAIDEAQVNLILDDAIMQAYADPVFDDPVKFAKLTHCGAQRPSATEWGTLSTGQDPPKGRIKHKDGLATVSNSVNIFKSKASELYTSDGSARLYIAKDIFEAYCCGKFGLEPQCSASNDLREMCDDICRDSGNWIAHQNSHIGFRMSTSPHSSSELQNQLQNIVDRLEGLQRDLKTCNSNIEEISKYRNQIQSLRAETTESKARFAECRYDLDDAEDLVAESADILAQSKDRLDMLKGKMGHANTAKEKLQALIDKATQEVNDLAQLLDKTKEELKLTGENLAQLSAANNIIMSLQEKVSALLLQVSATFDRVVGERIQKYGFEDKDIDEILKQLPDDIVAAEAAEFQALDNSIENMTSFCADSSNVEQLSVLTEHPEIKEFCTMDPPTMIGDQLKKAVQAHITEFKDWMAKTASEYKKYHGWATKVDPQTREEGEFEPLGYLEAKRGFESTGFFTDYITKWEHENGAFFTAYNKMLAAFAEKADKNSKLLADVVQTEAQFKDKSERLQKIVKAMKRLSLAISMVGKVRAQEQQLWESWSNKLQEYTELAKKKEAAMKKAVDNFEISWKHIVKHHKASTSLAQKYEEVLNRLKYSGKDQHWKTKFVKRMKVKLHGVRGAGQLEH